MCSKKTDLLTVMQEPMWLCKHWCNNHQ